MSSYGAGVRARLAGRLPVYYGWVVFALANLPSFGARPVASVAVLSVFVIPMTDQFGWSRGLFSGAVSLGAVCGLVMSPFAGRLIDRYGSGVILAGCSAVVGACALGLAAVTAAAWTFYAIYVPGRAVFSSPLELGTTTAISNWFIRRRPMALAWFGAVQGVGLGLLPLAAAALIGGLGWRSAWLALGIFTMATGILPPLLLMARRPEDMGLAADPPFNSPPKGGRRVGNPPPQGGNSPQAGNAVEMGDTVQVGNAVEMGDTVQVGNAVQGGNGPQGRNAPQAGNAVGNVAAGAWRDADYTVGEALRTPAFWILAFFSMAGFMVQAGVSLHQTAHYIDAGVSANLAALVATSFALGQIPGGVVWSAVGRRLPVRAMMAASALWVAGGVFGIALSETLLWGILAGFLFGAGVGGLHTLLRLAWADYYGRLHLGAIRGLTLPAQIGGQAIGPVLSGFMHDASDGYRTPFMLLGAAAGATALLVLAAAPPPRRGD